MTLERNSPRGGFAPLITRRDALALGVGSAAAAALPFRRASAAPATPHGRGTRAAALASLDRGRDARARQDQSSSNWRASPITRSKFSPSVSSTGSATGLICFST
jgi:hypothetical protein